MPAPGFWATYQGGDIDSFGAAQAPPGVVSLVRYQVIHRNPAAQQEEILDSSDMDAAQVFLAAEGRSDFHDAIVKRDGKEVCRLSAFRTASGRYWLISPARSGPEG